MFLTTLKAELKREFPDAKFCEEGSSLLFQDSCFVEYVKITECNNYVYFDQIFVAVAHQRKGIGSKVLGALIAACSQCGFTHIECRPTEGGGLFGVQFCRAKRFQQRENDGIWFISVESPESNQIPCRTNSLQGREP